MYLQFPLPGATIVILDSDPLIGITTDVDGYYRLENVKLGRYNLRPLQNSLYKNIRGQRNFLAGVTPRA